MRKTQEKLIARAIKNNWTPGKIEFLKNSTEPIRFLKKIFYFIQQHSEEELGNYSIVYELKEYIDSVYWWCMDIPVDVIEKVIGSSISKEDKEELLYWFTSALPPITVNECCDAYNLDTLMKQKYSRFTDVNWNKIDLSVGYLIFKTMSWVDEKSKGILLNQKNLKPDSGYFDAATNIDTKQFFLVNIIMKNLNPNTYWYDEEHNIVDENTVKTVVKDYISMSRKCKKKISLSFKSAKKLKEAHDNLVVIIANKHTPVIKIPKDTKFKTLRKILPEEFEWICSRRRIILEGKNMHHCVASYADAVNKDKCAIYSWINPDTQKRYTIEFRCTKKGQYYIEQIQGMCDRGCPKEVNEYVNSFIKTKY